jgi:hypothetical protein
MRCLAGFTIRANRRYRPVLELPLEMHPLGCECGACFLPGDEKMSEIQLSESEVTVLKALIKRDTASTDMLHYDDAVWNELERKLFIRFLYYGTYGHRFYGITSLGREALRSFQSGVHYA